MADDLFFFDMDLDSWHDGRAQTDSSFKEFYPGLSNCHGGDDAIDLRVDKSAPGHGQLSSFFEPATAYPVQLMPGHIGSNFASGICDATFGGNLLPEGHASILQMDNTLYTTSRPADGVSNEPDQWTTLMQKMTFVQDFVHTNETSPSPQKVNSQPESPPHWTESASCEAAAVPGIRSHSGESHGG